MIYRTRKTRDKIRSMMVSMVKSISDLKLDELECPWYILILNKLLQHFTQIQWKMFIIATGFLNGASLSD